MRRQHAHRPINSPQPLGVHRGCVVYTSGAEGTTRALPRDLLATEAPLSRAHGVLIKYLYGPRHIICGDSTRIG